MTELYVRALHLEDIKSVPTYSSCCAWCKNTAQNHPWL